MVILQCTCNTDTLCELYIDRYCILTCVNTDSECLFVADKLLAHVEQELKRLQRRKAFTSEESSSSHPQPQSHGAATPLSGAGSAKDQPLFTLKQVTIVCQRMLKEREEQIRGEYDKALTSKLAGTCTWPLMWGLTLF